mgnify:FL=1
MSSIETVSTEICTEDGDTVVVKTIRPGDFVVCNLASLSLGHLPLEDEKQMKEKVATVVRALDNVIELNFIRSFSLRLLIIATAVSAWESAAIIMLLLFAAFVGKARNISVLWIKFSNVSTMLP